MIPLPELLVLLFKVEKSLFRAFVFHFCNSEVLLKLASICHKLGDFFLLENDLPACISYFVLVNLNVVLAESNFVE